MTFPIYGKINNVPNRPPTRLAHMYNFITSRYIDSSMGFIYSLVTSGKTSSCYKSYHPHTIIYINILNMYLYVTETELSFILSGVDVQQWTEQSISIQICLAFIQSKYLKYLEVTCSPGLNSSRMLNQVLESSTVTSCLDSKQDALDAPVLLLISWHFISTYAKIQTYWGFPKWDDMFGIGIDNQYSTFPIFVDVVYCVTFKIPSFNRQPVYFL